MNIREVVDKDIIKKIVKDSKPNKEEKKGFFLFTDIDNNRYDTLYIIALENDFCVGIISYTEHCDISCNDYPYILNVQSIRKGTSEKLIRYIEKKIQTKGFKGVCLSSRINNIDMTEYYKKLGYISYDDKNMVKTFNNTVNDIKTESKLAEGLIGGSAGMDATLTASYGVQGLNYGYVYKILPLSMNLQQSGTPQKNEKYIHVGSRVSGLNKRNDKITGRVYRIVKNSDGIIIGLYIFSDKNHSIVKIKVEGLKLLESTLNEYVKILNENYTNDMAILCEHVKRNGKITLKSKQNNNIEYVLSLHEGEVKLFKLKKELNEKRIESIDSIFDVNKIILKSFLKKIDKI